jgi:hypothetical protein
MHRLPTVRNGRKRKIRCVRKVVPRNIKRCLKKNSMKDVIMKKENLEKEMNIIGIFPFLGIAGMKA